MGNGVADSSSGRVAERKRHSFFVDAMIRLVKEKPLGVVGGIITLLLLLTGIFADFIAPYGMNETRVVDMLSAPSARYWLGTDNLGRDILSRVIFGARISVIIGLATSTVATLISVVIGVVCGYLGGKFDLIVQRFVDAVMCFPDLILLMVLIAIIGPGIWQVIVVMGFRWGVIGSRIIRGATISVKENVYVAAAEAIGCSTTRILTRHILPNIMAPTIVLFSVRVPNAVLTEAMLSFLGFGIPPPAPSWDGYMAWPCPSYRSLWCKYVWRCGKRYTGPEAEGRRRAIWGESGKRSQSKK